MIKTEKELTLLQLLSQLHLNKIDEPKEIYLTEVSEFAEELEQNLYSLEESKQKTYLNRVREKFFDWIDENTVKRVSPKPKTKQEKNLRALVNTANYAIGVVETNTARFIYEVNTDFEDAKESFDKTYNGYRLSEAKEKYLLAQIKKTEKYIASVESEPEWQQFDSNQRYFEGGILFLQYLRETEKRDFPREEIDKTVKDKLTHRQQILTLHLIGFFDLPIFQTLSAIQKGILVSHLLNRTPKDSEDLIRYFYGKKKDKRFDTKTPENIKRVKQLLKKIGREDIEVK